jgi:hypothetical protein
VIAGPAHIPVVAALYVDPRGPYPKMPRVESWDEKRDARGYVGLLPVVAHPPCSGWSSLRHIAKLTHEQRIDCAVPAFNAVRSFGGVLEQPAGSKMFEHFGAPPPGQPADAHGGYTIEVSQVEWGHVARKKTWLYLVGVPREALEQAPFPGRQPTHWVSGSRATPGRKRPASTRYDAPPGIKICSAQQRNRTPQLFAEYLVRLAHAAHVARGGSP